MRLFVRLREDDLAWISALNLKQYIVSGTLNFRVQHPQVLDHTWRRVAFAVVIFSDVNIRSGAVASCPQLSTTILVILLLF